MRRFQLLSILLLPALVLSAALSGCGGGGEEKKTPPKKQPQLVETKLEELESKGYGTFTGTVVYDGTPPKPNKIEMKDNKDKDKCHEGAKEDELIEQTWIVNKENKGVENVIIFLKAPEGKFFKIKDEDKKKKDEVVLDQPHCAFRPHAFPHFASYYDKADGEWKRSGQVIKVVNDAKFNHNTKWAGAASKNPGNDKTLTPGNSFPIDNLEPDAKTPVTFQCNVHPWMRATCWVFDHPYAARTDKDGKFTITNVPTGVEVTVVAWHEASPDFTPTVPMTFTFKDGENKHDLKVKAK